ncbi:MAG: tetratricopeptide repeat protein [Candidatus Binatia bacterium]
MNRRRAADRPFLEFAAATLAAFVATWAAFGPGLHARFVSDDVNAIVENEWVAGPFDPAGIVGNFSWWGEGRADSVAYRPGATLSFAVNRQVSGADPSGFRIVNFALHSLCTGLLYALSRRLGLGREAAGAAALLFAVLPIHSEAVLWIVGRAELGAAAGFLIAALACLRYRENASWPSLVVAAVAVAAGITFKENAVTVLAAPAIYCLALGRERWRRDAAALGALAAGVGAYALLRWSADGPAIARDAGSLLDNPLSVLDTGTRLLGALAVFGRYIALTFWPASLSVDYSYDALAIGEGFRANADSLVAAAFLAAAAWAVWRGPGRRSVIAVGLLLAAASFSIVSNTVFVLGTILGERLFYLPTAGLCIALAALAEPLLVTRATRRPAAAFVAVLVLAAAGVAVNRHRSVQWLTPVSLFEAAATALPRSARAHMELASAYGNEGRVDEATRHFALAMAIKPDYTAAAYNQGNVLARAGRYDAAADAYRSALAIDARFARAWHNLALTERLRGRPEAWLDALRKAAEISPRSSALRSELAEALLLTGRHAEALSHYDVLIESGEAIAATHFNRGVARHHLEGCAGALEDYRQATKAPGAPREAFAAAAGCLRQLGQVEEAEALEQAAKVANRGTHR